jgi:hypothetical protein
MEKRKSDFNDRVWNDMKRENKKVNADDNKKSKQCLIKKSKSDDYVLTFMFALKIINRVLTAFILWNLLVITGRML